MNSYVYLCIYSVLLYVNIHACACIYIYTHTHGGPCSQTELQERAQGGCVDAGSRARAQPKNGVAPRFCGALVLNIKAKGTLLYTRMKICTYSYMSVCKYIQIYVYVCVYVYVYEFAHAHAHAYVHVYAHAYVHVYVYVYVYV